MLLPTPRTVRRGAGPGPGPDAPVVVSLDPGVPAQGYRLVVDAAGIAVAHRDPAGLRYALATLDQLRADRAFGQHTLVVEDSPDFVVRGFVLDISRDRVPTRRTLLRLLDLLALVRINRFELYTEHTFAHPGHEVVWRDASPITPEDLAWLDDRCAERGIELVPNRNTLGHMERWLRHRSYRDRAIHPDGFEIAGEHRPASTLSPTDANADLVGDLLDEMCDHVRSRAVNIGADEPWEMILDGGDGSAYVSYVARVADRQTAQGRHVAFWADVVGEHPERAGQIPEDTVPIVWQYDSPSLTAAVVEHATEAQRGRWAEIGLDVEELRGGFAARARGLTAAGRTFWVAPGTSAWQSFTGRLDNAVENLLDAADLGLAAGSEGYLVTSWGDHGAYDPPAVTFGPLLLAGALAWGVAAHRDLDLAAALNDHVLHDPSGVTGRVLVDIGRACAALDAPLLNASQLFTVLLRGGTLTDGHWPSPPGIEAADTILAAALDALDAADPACPDGDVVLRETRQAIRFARFGAEILRLGPGGVDTLAPPPARGLLTRLDALLDEHRRTWLLRSRPGGLDDSVARLAPIRRALAVRAAAS